MSEGKKDGLFVTLLILALLTAGGAGICYGVTYVKMTDDSLSREGRRSARLYSPEERKERRATYSMWAAVFGGISGFGFGIQMIRKSRS